MFVHNLYTPRVGYCFQADQWKRSTIRCGVPSEESRPLARERTNMIGRQREESILAIKGTMREVQAVNKQTYLGVALWSTSKEEPRPH